MHYFSINFKFSRLLTSFFQKKLKIVKNVFHLQKNYSVIFQFLKNLVKTTKENFILDT